MTTTPYINVMDFGAKGDGSTDDTTAIQNAINSLSGTGGIICFPAKTFVVNSGLTCSTNGVRFTGASKLGTVLTNNNHNVITLSINGFANVVEHMMILGNGLGATQPALYLGSGAVESVVEDCYIRYGSNAILINAVDFYINNIHADLAYGSAIVKVTNGGGFFIRDKLDQAFPVSQPPSGYSPAAWQASHAYSVGAVVSTGGYYIQCSTAGTSAGGAPTLQSYTVNITDGTVVWKLVGATTYYSLLLDSNTFGIYESQGDHSGSFTAGVAITNSSGTAPETIGITNSVFGGYWQQGILAQNGNDLSVIGCQFSNGISTTSSGINIASTWGGDTALSANTIFSHPVGISVNAGKNITMNGNKISNASTAAISVAANVNNFNIVGNELGTSTIWGANVNAVVVAAGTSDYYNIIGNNINGATTGITDGGTGTHKTVINEGVGGSTSFTLTTTGSSGPSTYTGGVLNIPQYTGGGGGSSTDTTSRRLQVSGTANNFVEEFIFDLTSSTISAWTTIRTLTPSNTTNVYLQGGIEARIDGATNAQGDGTRVSVWKFIIANGAPTIAVVGTDTTYGTATPNFRLNMSGNNIQVQVQSSNGTNNFESGQAYLKYFCPNSGVGTTWTIT